MNVTYQKRFDKAKSVIKEYTWMKFDDETKPLYIEVDAPGVGLGAALGKKHQTAKFSDQLHL